MYPVTVFFLRPGWACPGHKIAHHAFFFSWPREINPPFAAQRGVFRHRPPTQPDHLLLYPLVHSILPDILTHPSPRAWAAILGLDCIPLASYWLHQEHILRAWHPIGYTQSMFSVPGLLLATPRACSPCLASYWLHPEHAIRDVGQLGHMTRLFTFTGAETELLLALIGLLS
jgi:hypothetical protein